MQAALKTAVEQLASLGKPAGILAFNLEDGQRYIDRGYQFVAIGADLTVLVAGTQALDALFTLRKKLINSHCLR